MRFAEYLNRKDREALKHLTIVKSILEKAGLDVVDKTKERADPHLFVYSTDGDLSFEGVRIYNIGDKLAFRVQKNVDTQPYGHAYGIDIEELYEDMLGDDLEDKKIALEIGKAVIKEIKEFFTQSAKSEKELLSIRKDPLDRVMVRGSGSDYSNMMSADKKGGNIY
jgi:hypothetical protein